MGWALVLLARRQNLGPGGGGGYVPTSIRQALNIEHFLNQTLLLPSARPPRAFALVPFMFEELHPPVEGADCILATF